MGVELHLVSDSCEERFELGKTRSGLDRAFVSHAGCVVLPQETETLAMRLFEAATKYGSWVLDEDALREHMNNTAKKIMEWGKGKNDIRITYDGEETYPVTGSRYREGAKRRKCPNCGEDGPHFAPPSLGEEGFFICDKEPKPDGAEDILRPENLPSLEVVGEAYQKTLKHAQGEKRLDDNDPLMPTKESDYQAPTEPWLKPRIEIDEMTNRAGLKDVLRFEGYGKSVSAIIKCDSRENPRGEYLTELAKCRNEDVAKYLATMLNLALGHDKSIDEAICRQIYYCPQCGITLLQRGGGEVVERIDSLHREIAALKNHLSVKDAETTRLREIYTTRHEQMCKFYKAMPASEKIGGMCQLLRVWIDEDDQIIADEKN